MGMAYFEFAILCREKFVAAPREMVYRDGRPGRSGTPVNSLGLMVTSVSVSSVWNTDAVPINTIDGPICQQPSIRSSDFPPSYNEIVHNTSQTK